MFAALQIGVKRGKWHSLIDKVSRVETLGLGWTQVERNAGAARVDRMSVERFAQARDYYLAELAQALRDGSYRPQPVRRVYIPEGKTQRPLGIPAVKDRVVQAALKLVIEPIFEHEFEPRSFGFRQGLGCKDALREVDRQLKADHFWVVDADLQSYFDTIPHAALLAKVGERVADGRVLELVQRFLKQDIMEDMKRWTPTSGSPQGAVLSPLLSNLYLNEVDRMLERAAAVTRRGRYRYVEYARYADDLVVLVDNHESQPCPLNLLRKCGSREIRRGNHDFEVLLLFVLGRPMEHPQFGVLYRFSRASHCEQANKPPEPRVGSTTELPQDFPRRTRFPKWPIRSSPDRFHGR
jgi:RNA-directed DNA polymerase